MAPNDQSLGNNELGAWRIFSLFMLLLQKGPLPSAEIYTTIYSDLSTDSASRTFSRDRTVLKSLGFAITEVKTGKEKSFFLSDSNFFDSSYDLSPEDANQLLVICSAVLTDTTFVYQEELRNALSKIVGNFYSTDSDKLESQKHNASSQSKVFPVLYESLSSKQLVKVTYTNSQEQVKQKHLGILDFFISQGLLYFVAQDFSPNSKTTSIKTFRVDRVLDAAILKDELFSIPEDFDSNDYNLLDFQLGSQADTLTAFVPKNILAAFEHFSQGQGDIELLPNGALWTVAYAHEDTALSWILAHGLIPRSPESLLAKWKEFLSEVANGR
jgi:transcriptional regulator protein-like protein